MSLKFFHIKLVSVFTLIVMIWNVVGWMALKEVLGHTHPHTGNSYCTMTHCTCVIEEGVSICTCHHKEITRETASTHMEEGESTTLHFCFYSSPHNDSTSFSIGVTLHDYNGYLKFTNSPGQDADDKDYYLSNTHLNKLLIAETLLRPPIS